jgi:hypothetical protein
VTGWQRHGSENQQWQFERVSWKETFLEQRIKDLPGDPTIADPKNFQDDKWYISMPKDLLQAIFTEWRDSADENQHTEGRH